MTSDELRRSHAPRLIRTALMILVAATCVRVWVGPTDVLPPARAQIPDSGLQRKLLLAEARRTNALLAGIAETLTEIRAMLAEGRAGADRKTTKPHQPL